METKLKVGCTYRIWVVHSDDPYTGILTEVLPGWLSIELKSDSGCLYINMHHIEAIRLEPR